MKFLTELRFPQLPKYRNILLLVLFLPLLFIDNRSSHDWGDDFAQYIHQSKNIVQGIPQSETGFIYSQENYIGPTAYPVGFPLLLAPVYAVFGNSMLAFTSLISVFYFLLAFLLYLFYRRKIPEAAAIVLAFVFIYNPQMLLFKQEVMSDLPFTVFLALTFLLYPKMGQKGVAWLIGFGVLCGFLITIRSVGFVLIAAIIADGLLNLIRQRRNSRLKWAESAHFRQLVYRPGVVVISAVFFYYLLNSIIFRIPSGGSLRDYLSFYYSGNFLAAIPANLEHYIEVYRFIYTPVTGPFRALALLCGSAFLTMTLIGFLKKACSGLEIFDLFFIFYLLILLVFPNNDSAYRLLIPVVFLLLYYAALGFRSVTLLKTVSGAHKAVLLGILMFGLFLPGIIRTAGASRTLLDGPQQKETQQAFEYIQKNLPDSAVISFVKPRALALYTGHKGVADPFTTDVTSTYVQNREHSTDFVLVHSELTSETVKRYLRVMKDRVSLVWQNKHFRLYRINPFNPATQN